MKKLIFSLMLTAAMIIGTLPVGVMAAAPVTQLPRITVHMVGDSTVCNYSVQQSGITGWGQAFSALLTNRADVNNMAISGATTTSFLEGFKRADGTYAYTERWSAVLKGLKPGDYLFIQFGHNDQKVNDPDYIYAHATIDKYKENLRKMVTETAERGATPVIVTSPERKNYLPDKAETLAGYPAAAAQVAAENSVQLIDLNAMSKTYLSGLADATSVYATGDSTHFNAVGARELAKLVASNVDENLAKYININSEKEIFYPNTYINEDFQRATTDSANHALVTNGNLRLSYPGGKYGDGSVFETRVNEESDGNRSMEYVKYVSSTDGGSPYFYFGSETPEAGYVVSEFDIKLPSVTEAGGTARIYMQLENASYKRKLRLDFFSRQVSGKDTVYMYLYGANADKTGSRQIGTSEVCTLVPDKWNTIKILTDVAEKKHHIFVNDKLIATDIPDNHACGDSKTFKVMTLGPIYGGNTVVNNVFYDNIKVYTISEDRAVQLLLDGLDAFIGDKLYTADDISSRYVTINFPGSARLSGMTQAVDLQPGLMDDGTTAINSNITVRPESYNSYVAETTTSPKRIVYFYRPYGYNGKDWTGDAEGVRSYLSPIIRVGTTTEIYQTRDIKVKRTLLPSYVDGIEVGKPKLMNVADPTLTALPTVASVKAASDDLWTQTAVTNNTENPVKVVSALVIYSGNEIWYSSMATSGEIASGETKTVNNGRVLKATANSIPEGAVIKYFVWKADSFAPIVNTLICE